MWLFGDILSRLTFVASATTDRGLVRAENQDALVCRPADGCFAVADGMGGGQGGALASAWTCEALEGAFDALRAAKPGEAREIVEGALAKANARIHAYADENHYKMMGCTAALFFSDAPGAGWICHVGDSRIYRVRAGRAKLLTRDHTVGNELGRLAADRREADAARALKSRRNPLSHVLTRAVGTELSVRCEWHETTFESGDRWLVCTDGVHDMLDDAEITLALKRAADPAACAAKLTERIRAAGAADNFSFVCVFVQKG